MTATLTPNREAARAAIWWLFEGAMFAVILANTSGAASPPALDGSPDSWFSPTNYLLLDASDVFVAGGTSSYDASVPSKARLQQLQFVLDYNATYTYTDVLILCIPKISAPSGSPDFSAPLVAVIHEPTPITLLSTQTKTYKLDLTTNWI
jgi:hypothetical protein